MQPDTSITVNNDDFANLEALNLSQAIFGDDFKKKKAASNKEQGIKVIEITIAITVAVTGIILAYFEFSAKEDKKPEAVASVVFSVLGIFGFIATCLKERPAIKQNKHALKLQKAINDIVTKKSDENAAPNVLPTLDLDILIAFLTMNKATEMYGNNIEENQLKFLTNINQGKKGKDVSNEIISTTNSYTSSYLASLSPKYILTRALHYMYIENFEFALKDIDYLFVCYGQKNELALYLSGFIYLVLGNQSTVSLSHRLKYFHKAEFYFEKLLEQVKNTFLSHTFISIFLAKTWAYMGDFTKIGEKKTSRYIDAYSKFVECLNRINSQEGNRDKGKHTGSALTNSSLIKLFKILIYRGIATLCQSLYKNSEVEVDEYLSKIQSKLLKINNYFKETSNITHLEQIMKYENGIEIGLALAGYYQTLLKDLNDNKADQTEDSQNSNVSDHIPDIQEVLRVTEELIELGHMGELKKDDWNISLSTYKLGFYILDEKSFPIKDDIVDEIESLISKVENRSPMMHKLLRPLINLIHIYDKNKNGGKAMQLLEAALTMGDPEDPLYGYILLQKAHYLYKSNKQVHSVAIKQIIADLQKYLNYEPDLKAIFNEFHKKFIAESENKKGSTRPIHSCGESSKKSDVADFNIV